MRILALMCMLASMPVACVKYPWLPATAAELAKLQLEPAHPEGTESYLMDRARRRDRLIHALAIYALGTASLVGLSVVALGGYSRKIDATSWILSAVTGVAIAQFEQPLIGPSTDNGYVLIVTYLPLGISFVAGTAGLITLAEPQWDTTGDKPA
jgi:hypothetical protein